MRRSSPIPGNNDARLVSKNNLRVVAKPYDWSNLDIVNAAHKKVGMSSLGSNSPHEPFMSFWESDANFAHHLRKSELFSTPTLIEPIMRSIGKSTLIDLGCGGGLDDDVVEMFVENGMTRLIEVDRYSIQESKWYEFSNRDNILNIILIHEDMLGFLRALSDKQNVNFTLNGIDESVLRDSDYAAKVGEQIVRVLGEGNIVFGLNIHSSLRRVLEENLHPMLARAENFYQDMKYLFIAK